MIKAHNTQRKWEEVKDFIVDGLESIHASEKIFNAKFTQQVEQKLKTASGRKYALTCASGSHAITMSLRANNINPGDNVIIPNYSCPATLSSVMVMGAIPVFCEIDEHGMMSMEHLPNCMNDKVKAVLATGLYGDVHDHQTIKDFCSTNNLHYINDAAQSQFAKYKGVESLSLGDVVCMSFADNKVIPTAGTYGAMLTDSEDLYNKLRALRKNGKPTRLEPYSTAGYSSQPEEEKAVQILASWQHLYKWQTRKQEISRYYFENLKNKITIRPSPLYSGWNAHKFAIMVDDKFSAHKKMLEAGVETEQHYADNFASLSWTPKTDKKFPMTDKFVKQSLTIPNNPFMTDAEVEVVTKKVIDILA